MINKIHPVILSIIINSLCLFVSFRDNPPPINLRRTGPWLIFFFAEFVYQFYHLCGRLPYPDEDTPGDYAVADIELAQIFDSCHGAYIAIGQTVAGVDDELVVQSKVFSSLQLV